MIIRHPVWNEVTIGQLLAAGPGERVIFAPARLAAGKLAEMMVALANAHGGVIVAGAAARGPGIASGDELDEVARNAQLAATPPLILPLPQIVVHDGKTFGLIEVPPGLPHAYNLDGRYLTHAGGQTRLLTAAELSALLLQRSEAGFEARPVPGATAADLDPAQVESYQAAVEGPSAREPWESLLLARGCLVAEGGQVAPSHAGMLLFGRQPQRFLHNAEIILVRYAGPAMSDQFVRHDAGGTLPEQIRQAEAFVLANMRRGMRLAADFVREEATEYPLAVVREAIVNAVAHRDYAIRGEGIRVLMFSEHMEIYSPGRLPGHITVENMLEERFSRNEAIVQVLSDLGFVERLGYGIDRMVAALAEAGLPAPRFEETAAGFRVMLYGRGDELVSPATAPRWGNRRVSPRQERALAHVAEHGSITNREYHDLFPDVSDETIRRDLADLVDGGLLLKIGDRKATYYILK